MTSCGFRPRQHCLADSRWHQNWSSWAQTAILKGIEERCTPLHSFYRIQLCPKIHSIFWCNLQSWATTSWQNSPSDCMFVLEQVQVRVLRDWLVLEPWWSKDRIGKYVLGRKWDPSSMTGKSGVVMASTVQGFDRKQLSTAHTSAATLQSPVSRQGWRRKRGWQSDYVSMHSRSRDDNW